MKNVDATAVAVTAQPIPALAGAFAAAARLRTDVVAGAASYATGVAMAGTALVPAARDCMRATESTSAAPTDAVRRTRWSDATAVSTSTHTKHLGSPPRGAPV